MTERTRGKNFLRTRAVPLAATAALLSVLAACGDSGDDGGDAGDGPSSPAAKAGTAVDLSGECPEKVVVQTSWLPNATSFGPLYAMLGPDADIDANSKRVSGSLVAGGKDTGVELEVRAGGPAVGNTPTSALMRADKDIHLGVAGGFDEIIQNSDSQPMLAVLALLEKDPQMVFWDPETYPDVRTIEDLGKTDATVTYFGGSTYMEYLTEAGILKKSQVDGSFQGDPGRFVAEDGKIASVGYATEYPYTFEHVLKQWGKPIEFQLVYDAGYRLYGAPLGIRPEDQQKLGPCLEKLVPVIQQAQVDYAADPDDTIDRIVEISEAYKGGDLLTKEVADYGVRSMKELGLAANDADGKDSTVGNFADKRVQEIISIDEPIFAAQNNPIKDGLTPADVVTNEYIDPEIGF